MPSSSGFNPGVFGVPDPLSDEIAFCGLASQYSRHSCRLRRLKTAQRFSPDLIPILAGRFFRLTTLDAF
jgi:hypothetical protein